MNEKPDHFATLVLSLAGAAQMALGLVPNPQTGKTEKNLGGAKDTITLIEVLKEKTKGNLTKEEEDLFDQILFQLRMSYVEANK